MIEQRNTIIQGDALEVLKTLPDGIVQTCVTSPPYYGLRDYGVKRQIGLEDTPEAYIARLVEVFREVKRVLRDDGTLWVNIGDSYARAGGYSNNCGLDGVSRYESTRARTNAPEGINSQKLADGYKSKDLIGIPWMLAFALRADGWYLRSDIIWAKSNCMPESVTDRPTKSHEYIFLLSKSERYFYDAEAIKEANSPTSAGNRNAFRGGGVYTNNQSFNNSSNVPVSVVPGMANEWTGRNKRSVWTVSTMPYSEAHFATFPPKLIEPCILAGTSPRACEHCGASWERVTEHMPMVIRNGPKAGGYGSRTTDGLSGTMIAPAETHTTGWQPTCSHTNDGTAQSIVLDPFMGAGTVALVSTCHSRSYIGIELNPEYVKMARQRIATIQPDLWSAAEVLSVVRERLAEAIPEEADELLDKLDALIEEKGGVA